ncbi:hypothetical protein PROFUN_12911 [Planoprotostelium fungivorum]|uniref:Transmembrane protein n=1 Tax=Planoprotostelium fungivorum TaxID=1890364 RepID=A0A2P6N5Y5_9EUKA|nr:hypothetical protein PROFUN_12911 [Planoprotostelium fungivorum]
MATHSLSSLTSELANSNTVSMPTSSFLFLSLITMAGVMSMPLHSRNDYGLSASVISSSLLKLYNNNGTSARELWETLPSPSTAQKSHFHLILSNMLFLATGIVLSAQFGRLRTRRNVLYVVAAVQITILTALERFYFAWLALWGIFHSCAHHFWPFITVAGLNIKATAFPDVFVHLTMHVIVHSAACQLGISDATRLASSLVLVGCLWNAYLAYYSRVDEKWFVYTSMFQALSTGSWVGHLLSVSLQHNQAGFVYESNLWLMWGGAAMNWFLFKNSNKMLKKLFTISYLDTLFIFPVWLYMCNNWI